MPVAIDFSYVLFMGTQESCNFSEPEMIHNEKQSVAVQVIHEDSENGDSENADSENEEWMYPGQVNFEEHKREHNRQVAAELELIKKLRSEKREKAMDHEAVAIMEKMEQMKKQGEDPCLHFEGDTDVEEFFDDVETENDIETNEEAVEDD